MKPVIAVFGSGKVKPENPAYQFAFEVGRELALAGFDICNGGYGGAMEAAAKGAKEARGKTIAIVAEEMRGTPNRWMDEIQTVATWRERLFALIDRVQGYVVLDGATGTLVEFMTVWELTSKKLLSKPVVMAGENILALFHYLTQREEFKVTDWLQQASDPKDIVKILKAKLKQ